MPERITPKLNVRAIECGVFITGLTTKTSLVRQIQVQEGHARCFRTDARDSCHQTSDSCEWAKDCKQHLIASWKR